MNLAVRGLSGDVREISAYRDDLHKAFDSMVVAWLSDAPGAIAQLRAVDRDGAGAPC